MKNILVGSLCLSAALVVLFFLQNDPQTARAAECTAVNGDVDGSGGIDVADVIEILNYAFVGTVEGLIPLCSSEGAGCSLEGLFIDNGDGTVTDTRRGLMWQKQSAPGSYTWQGAMSYCENLDFANHSDWRLPDVRELQSIVDYDRFNPAINPVFSSSSVWYWSSSQFAGDTSYAGVVGFYNGGIDHHTLGSRYAVRAVRSAQ